MLKKCPPIILAVCLSLSTIAAQNDETFHEILSYGRGVPQSVYWQPDGDTILVNAITGVWLYSGNDLSDLAHLDALHNATFSPDGRWIIGADSDGQSLLYDTDTHAPLTLTDDFRSPAFSPDGRWLLGSIGEKPVLLETAHFQPVAFPSEYEADPSKYLIWSPDSQKILVVGEDYSLSIWYVGDNSPVEHIEAALTGFPLWSPDSRKIMQNDPVDNRVKIWDAVTRELLIDIPAQAHQPFYREGEQLNGYVSWAADRNRIVRFFPTDQGVDIQFCDAQTGEPLKVLKTQQMPYFWFSPDGQRLALPEGLYDLNTYEKIANLNAEYSLLWSPDSRYMAFADTISPQVHVLDGSTGAELHVLKGEVQGVGFNFIIWSPDSTKLLTWGEADGFILSDAASGKILAQADHTRADRHIRIATYAAFSADGKFLVAADKLGILRLWNVPQRAYMRPVTNHLGEVDTLLWQPGGTLLVTQNQRSDISVFWDGVDDRNIVYIRDVGTGSILHTITRQAALTSVTWSPDGKQLLVGNDADNSVLVWDAATNTESTIDVQLGHGYVYYPHISLSPDGQILLLDYSVATHGGQAIRLIDSTTEKVLASQIQYSYPGLYAWSPDSQKLRRAVRSCPINAGCTVQVRILFDRAHPPFDTVQEYGFNHPIDFVTGTFNDMPNIYWSPNGQWMVVTSGDGLQVWDVERRIRVSLAKNIRWMSWSPDGNRLALVFASGAAQVIGLTADSQTIRLENNATRVDWLANNLFMLSAQDHVEIRDAESGSLLLTRPLFPDTKIVASPDGSAVADLSGGVIRVYARD